MASLFNTVDVGSPLGSSVTPASPVADQSAEILVGAASTLAKGAFAAIEENAASARAQATRDLKVADETEEGRAVAALTSKLSDISNAVENGMSSAEAGIRKRTELNRLQAENPRWANSLQSSFNAFGTDAGAVTKTGNLEEQAYKDDYKSAQSEGKIPAGTSPKETPYYVELWRKGKGALKDMQTQSEKLGLIQKELSIKGSRLSNETAALALEEKQVIRKLQVSTKTAADANLPVFRAEVQDIVRRSQQPGADRVALQMELDNKWSTIQTIISDPRVDSAYASALSNPFKTIMDNSKDVINGKMELDMYQNRVETAMAQAANVWSGDPAKLMTASLVKYIPGLGSNPIITGQLADMALPAGDKTLSEEGLSIFEANNKGYPARLRTQGGDVTPVTQKVPKPVSPYEEAHKVGFDNYFNYTKSTLTSFVSGKDIGGKEGENQLHYNVGQILAGYVKHQSAVDEPGDLKEAAEFVASDTFRQYVKKTGGIPGGSAAQDGLKELFSQHYVNGAERAIRNEFLSISKIVTDQVGSTQVGDGEVNPLTQATGVGVREVSLPGLVELTYSGGRPVFKTRQDVQLNRQERDFVDSHLKTLNDKPAKLLQQIIRINSNITGVSEQEVFRDIYNNILQDASNE